MAMLDWRGFWKSSKMVGSSLVCSLERTSSLFSKMLAFISERRGVWRKLYINSSLVYS